MNVNIRLLITLVVTGILAYFAYPPDKKIPLGLDLKGGVHIEAQIDLQELATKLGKDSISDMEKSTYLDQAIVVIRERINQTGLTEAEVRKGGVDRIVLQIPGYAKKDEAEKLLTQVGYLEFSLVSEDDGKINVAMKNKKIPGYRLLYLTSGKQGEKVSAPLLVKEKPEFDGTFLESSQVSFSQNFNEPQVNLSFTGKGAKLFAAVTRKNIGRRLAIILDNVIVSAPAIQTEIPSGNAVITGKFTLDEAKQLSLILNAGALPAKIKIVESRVVSATLGKDSIAKGAKASVLGLIFVAIFMIIYYLKAGVISVFALSLNVICILGCIAYIDGATLTLPGIAGLILTMGMAVDANVLIFERMREEIKKGKRIKTAVTAGYEKAFLTIVDANLTTFFTSLILYNFGKGPVKGFALILMIGIVTSMFTALFVTRVIFDLLLKFNMLEKIQMLLFVPELKIKFISNRKKTYIISLIVIALSIFGFLSKGDKKYGIDFGGGSLLELSFKNDVQIDELRNKLKDLSQDVSLQYFGSQKEILIRAKTGQNEEIKKLIGQNTKGGAFEISREEEVGPLVGKELKRSSIIAILLSLLCIIIYIAFRFEFKFAVGAIVALIHDVTITAGLYCLFGYEMNVPTIAALLTIVGYSLNDTIVIFDRIRENLSTNIKKSQIDLIDEAINSTLSRTLLTSLTTLLVVISILIFGGGIIHDFAFTLFIGIIVGTYSSIFVAAPLLIDLKQQPVK